MKYATTIILIVFIGLLSQTRLMAQNIDKEQMNRDIRISKTVLGELFTPNAEKNKEGVFSFGEKDYKIYGTYLPDYGVMFVINDQSVRFTNLSVSVSKDSGNFFKIKYNNKDEKPQITKKNIINQIKYFLRTYGPTIGQLAGNDRLTVIYQSNSDDGPMFKILKSDTVIKPEKKLPSKIIVSTDDADLQALTHGSINKNQFDERLRVSASKNSSSQHHDVDILATIFKTEFKKNNHKFSISDSVQHLYVKGVGGLLFADASYEAHSPSRLFLELNNSFKNLQKLDTASTFIQVSKTPNFKTKITKFKKQKKEYFKQFLNQLRQTLVDYGRTVKSISPDESIFLIVDITNTGLFPDHIKLQISQSVLQAYNKGEISRQQAIDKIIVRKY